MTKREKRVLTGRSIGVAPGTGDIIVVVRKRRDSRQRSSRGGSSFTWPRSSVVVSCLPQDPSAPAGHDVSHSAGKVYCSMRNAYTELTILL